MVDINDLKFLGRWKYEIELEDDTLKAFMNTRAWVVPKTGGRYQNKRFGRRNIPIIERFIGRMMTPGHFGSKHRFTSYYASGEYYKNLSILVKVFEIIENETKQNPIKILVKAIENAAPREEITNIEMGGSRYPKAVDISPLRRIDLAIRFIIWGAYHNSRNKKDMVSALSREIILAYKNSTDSYAIQKKLELERLASSSR
ncbi:30S ribosomal protein S7 [Nanobdella aerobiophila]|uniref:30S ribosomal protein S7 n=1 Tax=Nanobdella aerobiophila TaxID=2586965 RepID=A0A915SKG1_9ARCH|nr:30S ribosomal protein S7 [Nanobdella aerobiophila]BBL45301.1 30S ribosomal protein S7 [Nanobdella aerobiophila]